MISKNDEKCRALISEIEEVESQLAATVKVSKIDVYKNASLAARLGTIEAPSIIYTKNGEIVAKENNVSKENIINTIKNIES